MRKRHIATFAIMANVATTACSSSAPELRTNATLPMSVNLSSASPASSLAAAEAEKLKYLANLVPADTILHSFHAHEGIWIDCVDVNRQPSMRTPPMAGKGLEQPPPLPTNLAVLPPGHQRARQDVEDHANEVDENGNVRHCEPGTIPMRRTTAADLAPFATLDDFFAKGPDRASLAKSSSPGPGSQTPPSIAGYEYARGYQNVTNWGLNSLIAIYHPYLETLADHSISQIWVANNSGTPYTETAEAGWIVGAPFDDQTRLFIYWTDDNYQTTGCYNLGCPGFVQTSNYATLGGAFSTISGIGTTQYDVALTWVKSYPTAPWWFFYQGYAIGYLPTNLYGSGMGTQASLDVFGGEVYNSEPGGVHTSTAMGSGQFASGGWEVAAFQDNIKYFDTKQNVLDVTPSPSVTNVNCYSLSSGYDSGNWNSYEFLGGVGWSTNCP